MSQPVCGFADGWLSDSKPGPTEVGVRVAADWTGKQVERISTGLTGQTESTWMRLNARC